MSAPLVSVSGVLVSEIVSTQQPTARGAVALCSSGVLSGALIARARRGRACVPLASACARLGPRCQDMAHLAVQQTRGHLGLREVIDPRRPTAPVRLGQLDNPEPGNLGQEL